MRTYVINSENRASFTTSLNSMFRQRKLLFVDRLGWSNMKVEGDQERDEADNDPNVVYLVTIDSKGTFIGSCRMTPTQGLCLLGGPLANYLDAPIAGASDCWELTRFAPTTDPRDPSHGQSFAFLATGVIEWALENGISKVYGIAEPPLMAIAGGLGWKVKLEGPPIEYEVGKQAFAFSFPPDIETFTATKSAFRLGAAVLAKTEDERVLAA
jgi:N-acyl-L-homoserine lactone synthetase